MLPVAQKLFSNSGSRSGFNSTQQSLGTRTNVPFILPSKISTKQPTHCGRGIIVPVSGAANTPITVTHNLGRIVQGFWPLINDDGKTFTPKLRKDAAVQSLTQQTIIADEDLKQCLIVFF